ETVSYILDGEIAHHDTNGGGGVIGEGDTQWMTAGGGILHDELPTERMYRGGGPAHAVQLWVNLPARLKMTPPRYQSITRDALRRGEPLDVLWLGGLPIREPIAHYGPFVMNTREEILQAVDDFQAGRLGIVPADQLAPRNFA